MANQEQWRHAHVLVKVLREILPRSPDFPACCYCAVTVKANPLRACVPGPPT